VADYQVYGPGALSYAPLEIVVENRGWEGTEEFDMLVAPSDCNLLARQGWVITKEKIFNVVVVDCEAPEHKGQLEERGLLLDQNLKEMTSKKAWLIIR